jgi:DMSO/TMAO reductase YedYZ molybdopterin-dependent catalytic subunit
MKERVPPNQVVTSKFPVLSISNTPRVSREEFELKIVGSVDNPLTLKWEDLMRNFPKVEKVLDFHCVTGWSRLEDKWEGIPFKSVLEIAKPRGHFLVLHSYDGYTTNVPIDYAMREDSLLAFGFNGNPLDPDHGGPLRALIPYLYAWKSAKWLHIIEVTEENMPGYWEQRGYHMLGDPWKEQRYSGLHDFLSILNFRRRRRY